MTHDSRVDPPPLRLVDPVYDDNGVRMRPEMRARLAAARFSIGPVCDVCAHGVFVRIGPWGRCNLHSKPRAPVVVLRFGTCPSHKESAHRVGLLQGYGEFLEPAF